MNRETRQNWDTLVTLAAHSLKSSGGLWDGKLRPYAPGILAADAELRLKNNVLSETAWRLAALLTRGDFAPDDEPITRRWLKRVRAALRPKP